MEYLKTNAAATLLAESCNSETCRNKENTKLISFSGSKSSIFCPIRRRETIDLAVVSFLT